jgi:hypothetical protein
MTSNRIDRYRMEDYKEGVSEFSASLTDLFRLRYYIARCDAHVFNICQGISAEIIPLFSNMKVVWYSLRVVIFMEIRESFDKRMNEMEKYIMSIRKSLEMNRPAKPTQEKIDEMLNLYRDLLQYKQNCGLGFSIRKEKSLEERLKNTLLS